MKNVNQSTKAGSLVIGRFEARVQNPLITIFNFLDWFQSFVKIVAYEQFMLTMYITQNDLPLATRWKKFL